MITVTDAGALQGYSALDHLIEDETNEIVGHEFRCVGDALRAADRHCFIARHGDKKRRNHPYTWIEVRFASGERREFKSVK